MGRGGGPGRVSTGLLGDAGAGVSVALLGVRVRFALELAALLDEAREDAGSDAAELPRGDENAFRAGVGEEGQGVVPMSVSPLFVAVSVLVLAM